jgi:hypothetical protein
MMMKSKDLMWESYVSDDPDATEVFLARSMLGFLGLSRFVSVQAELGHDKLAHHFELRTACGLAELFEVTVGICTDPDGLLLAH